MEEDDDLVPVMSSKDIAVQHVCELVQSRLGLASPDDVWRLSPEQLEAALTSPPRATWASRARATVVTARTVLDVAIVTGRIATVVTLVARLHGVLRF